MGNGGVVLRFTIYPDSIKSRISELNDMESQLGNIVAGLEDVINTGSIQTGSYTQVKRALRNYQRNIQMLSGNAGQLRSGLESVLQEYRNHEQTVSEKASRHSFSGGEIRKRNPLPAGAEMIWEKLFPAFPSSVPGILPGILPGSGAIGAGFALWDYIQDIYDRGYNDSSGKGVSWSVTGGSAKWGTNFHGMDLKTEGEYHLGHFKTSGSTSASWKMDDTEKKGEWDVKAEANGEAGFSLADGKISGSAGMAKGTVEASIGNLGVAGSVGFSLVSDGKFAPSVYGKVSAEANAAKGNISGQIGSEEYNVHGKAEGTLLKAEAKAEIQAGRIVDEKGNVKYGVSAKAGGEAYVAEGSVSGGLTLFGIKFEGSVTGKAGGAGAKAGGEVTSGAAEGEVGLGLGLGVGLKVKIDWTGFKWPW